MRLSDAGLRRPKTKLIYPDHRLPPWLTEDAPSDRSNRVLGPPGGRAHVFFDDVATKAQGNEGNSSNHRRYNELLL